MFSHTTYALVTCLMSLCSAIRVDFNTNEGPIVPPTPRTTARPVPPFREPAAVWEDQSLDIPNPNPYIYVLPPPSRPRQVSSNFATAGQKSLDYYGNLLLPSNENTYPKTDSTYTGGGSFAAKFMTNVGIKYTSVLPTVAVEPLSKNNKNNIKEINRYNSGGFNFGVGDKYQGKYNAKTKKYKAYEKVKYVPQIYYPLLEYDLPLDKPYTNEYNQEQLMRVQQLPLPDSQTAFRPFHDEESATEARLDAPITIPITTTISSTTSEQSKLSKVKGQVLAETKLPATKSLSKLATTKPNYALNAIFSEKTR